MDKRFLLTYQTSECKHGTFSWFDTEEEMDEFINESNIHVVDAIEIIQLRNLLED